MASSVAAVADRRHDVAERVVQLFAERTGHHAADIERRPIVELGDSLLLLELSQAVHETFGVAVPFRLMLEELATVDRLADYITRSTPRPAGGGTHGPPSAASGGAPAPFEPARPQVHPSTALPPAGSAPFDETRALLAQQLQVMAQQLDLLARRAHTPPPETAPPADGPPPAAVDDGEVFVPYQAVERTACQLTAAQQQWLQAFVQRVTARTQRSKARAESSRHRLADSTMTAGFQLAWKELCYPLVVDRADGSRIRDLDGHEYVDFTMGFGALLFGHSPAFLLEALDAQLRRGVCLGPQADLAAAVAELTCELTGMERVTFCNSGTEAVMTALRLARTATGRNRIALFAGSYHGTFDGVLARPATRLGTDARSVPMAPGVPPGVIQDVIVLPYASPQSFEVLEREGAGLAAILVEPVQSRRPDLSTAEFLAGLRRIADRHGAALIFDEVITGFRLHLGGSQALFGVRADIATYGKAMGGGLPIGAVAGRARYLDAVDGGDWRFGDDSYPGAQTTLVVGTFFKHPLVMAGCRAVLEHLKQSGPRLQQELTDRTLRLVARLEAIFSRESIRVRVVTFGSAFRLLFPREARFAELLYYHLLLSGVFVWEGRVFYVSTAHTDEDFDRLCRAVEDAIRELKAHDLLPQALPQAAPVPPPAEPARIELTDAQRELWFLARLDEGASRAFHLAAQLRFAGRFDLPAMRRAVARLIQRHEALRTTIAHDGTHQRVAPGMALEVPVADVSDLTEEARAAAVAREIARDRTSPFDLTRGPLLRVRVVTLHDDEHLCLFTAHHIIADAWAFGVLQQELLTLYQAECTAEPARLPEPLQLTDYVQHLARLRAGGVTGNAERYWLDTLRDPPAPLELPGARPRAAQHTFLADRLTLRLDASVAAPMRRLASRAGVTPFMLLLAAFRAWLWRATGERDSIVGIFAAGRRFARAERLVANCVSLLPLRTRVPADPAPFSQWLALVRGDVADAQDHDAVSFGRIVTALRLPREANRAPLVNITFNMDPEPRSAPATRHVQVLGTPPASIVMDLNCSGTWQGEELLLDWDYNREIYDGETVRAWQQQFETLLRGVLDDPDRPISTLPLASASERQLFDRWNATRVEAPAVSLDELIAAQAARTPDAIAVVDADRQITYGALDRAANRLANHLRARGAGPQARVGLCVERSADLVVSLLGIMKSRASYVPLDAAQPIERLTFMMADAGVTLVVTQRAHADLCAGADAGLVGLEVDAAAISRAADSPPPERAHPASPAYVIYTSGSTGRPKGVVISHQALTNVMTSLQAQIGVTSSDVWAAVTSIGFDISGLELLLPLTVGARVAVTGGEALGDGSLPMRVAALGATIMQATPAMWRLLLASGWSGTPPLVVLCGGEALAPELARHLRQRARRVWNLYGPTETTIWSTAASLDEPGERVSIGGPIGNTQVHVVDAAWQLAPIGLAGELLIGGAGLAQGYSGRPALTAQRFVPDAFGPHPGARVYRTGDRARWRPDGQLEFIGRGDLQVKIRGFRVEPGEVEAVLAEHPGVAASAVVALPASGGEQRLVAYIVPTDGPMPTAGTLRAHLRRRLPDYMIPAVFVELPALPLNANGKVNRRALPPPSTDRPSLDEAPVEPRTPLERTLTRIWSEVLRVTAVGVADNFFELGGDSILAIQIVARANEAGLPLLPRHVFEHQTIAGLAEAMAAAAGETAEQRAPMPLTPAQHAVLDAVPSSAPAAEVRCVESRTPLDRAHLVTALRAVVAHHDALRLRFRRDARGWVQEVASSADVSATVVEISATGAGREESLSAFAASVEHALDGAGPLVRVALCHGAAAAARLVIAAHPLVVDELSWPLLLSDLETAYVQAAAGAPVELPRTCPYGTWAARLKSGMESALGDELSFWREQIEGQAATLPFAADGDPAPAASRQTVTVSVNPTETRAVVEDVQRAYRMRPEEVVLTAVAQVLTAWTGTARLRIELDGDGRRLFNDLDTTRTVGRFAAPYPLIVDLGGLDRPGAALKAVKEQLRAVPRGGAGYAVLREAVSGALSIPGPPAPTVRFTWREEASPGPGDARLLHVVPGPGDRRPGGRAGRHLLEIDAVLRGGEIVVSWTDNSRTQSVETMSGLAGRFRPALRALIEHCQSTEAGGYTPSDFPLAGIDQAALDALLQRLAPRPSAARRDDGAIH